MKNLGSNYEPIIRNVYDSTILPSVSVSSMIILYEAPKNFDSDEKNSFLWKTKQILSNQEIKTKIKIRKSFFKPNKAFKRLSLKNLILSKI